MEMDLEMHRQINREVYNGQRSKRIRNLTTRFAKVTGGCQVQPAYFVGELIDRVYDDILHSAGVKRPPLTTFTGKDFSNTTKTMKKNGYATGFRMREIR